jgi:hypothetical protein
MNKSYTDKLIRDAVKLLEEWSYVGFMDCGLDRPTEEFLIRANQYLKDIGATYHDQINKAIELMERNQPDAALDVLYDATLDRLMVGNYQEVNTELDHPFIYSLDTDLLIGLLTTTRSYKNKLSNRPSFYEKVRKTLDDRGEHKELLRYLE